MYHRENINNVLGQAKRQSRAKREKRMADFLGHSSTSEATLSITNDLITLSQVLTYNSTSYIYRPRACVTIRLSFNHARKAALFFSVNQ